VLRVAPEPGRAPAPTTRPAGRVLHLDASGAEGVVVDGSSRYAVVATRAPDRLRIVDLSTFTTSSVLVSPGGARHLQLAGPEQVIVPGEDTDTVSVLSIPDGKMISQVHTPRQPHDATELPGGVLVTVDELANSVTASSGDTIIGTIGGITQPGGVTAANGYAAVVEVRGRILDVFSVRPLELVGRVAVGAGPTHVVGLGDGTVAVADTDGDKVFVVHVGTKPKVLTSFDLPGRPYGVAVDVARRRLWVATSGDNLLHEYATGPAGSTPAPIRTFPTVQQPNSLAVVPSTGQVIVAGSTKVDATLEEITP
ncbi:MAG: YncE family protein, partial [Mycobacteriales bacterium]